MGSDGFVIGRPHVDFATRKKEQLYCALLYLHSATVCLIGIRKAVPNAQPQLPSYLCGAVLSPARLG